MLLENNNNEDTQEKSIDYKKIFFLMLRLWHFFLLFGIIGLAAGYVYNKLSKPKYTVIASILVPEKSQGIDTKSIFEKVLEQQSTNIYNQLAILGSYFQINQALTNLNWRTNWYKKEILVWRGIYKQEPFEVKETPNFKNLEGIPIFITPTTGESYDISVNYEVILNKVKTKVKFEGVGTFGHPFTNSYFNFTLLKKTNDPEMVDGSFKFTFTNLNELTLDYQKRLDIQLKIKQSDIIECTIIGEEPLRDGEFLNELLKVYIDNKINLENEAQKRSLTFINDQLSSISDSLNIASRNFTAFRAKNKIIDLGVQGTLVMNSLKEIESERSTSQIQLDYFNNLHSYLTNPGDANQLVSPSVVGIDDAALNKLVVKIGELYSNRQILSFSAKENNPTLALIDNEITQTRSLLNENLRNLIENATKSINSLKERQSILNSQLNDLPEKEQHMITIQQKFDLTNEIYTFLLQKRAETNIALASSISDVQIVDIARPDNSEPMGLPANVILILGFMMGIALPLGVVLVINSVDDRIRSQEDIENKTTIPIMGNILHNNLNSNVAVSENPKSVIAETFRTLRTNLQFMISSPDKKVISILSVNPGEGKSFMAVNLAAILAMNHKKVLLIGADLRKPKLHSIFNFGNDHGLSTYLIGYDTLEKAILPTSIKNLSLLPSGPIPPNPSELLDKPEMKTLIEKVRASYDYIIMDNAPVSLVTDGLIVSKMSDLNIFILRYGVSQKHQLEMINQYAVKEIINHLGIVVNDIKINAFGFSFSKYSRYEVYQKNTYKNYTAEN